MQRQHLWQFGNPRLVRMPPGRGMDTPRVPLPGNDGSFQRPPIVAPRPIYPYSRPIVQETPPPNYSSIVQESSSGRSVDQLLSDCKINVNPPRNVARMQRTPSGPQQQFAYVGEQGTETVGLSQVVQPSVAEIRDRFRASLGYPEHQPPSNIGVGVQQQYLNIGVRMQRPSSSYNYNYSGQPSPFCNIGVRLPQPSVRLPQPSIRLPQPSVRLPQPSVRMPAEMQQPHGIRYPVWNGFRPVRPPTRIDHPPTENDILTAALQPPPIGACADPSPSNGIPRPPSTKPNGNGNGKKPKSPLFAVTLPTIWTPHRAQRLAHIREEQERIGRFQYANDDLRLNGATRQLFKIIDENGNGNGNGKVPITKNASIGRGKKKFFKYPIYTIDSVSKTGMEMRSLGLPEIRLVSVTYDCTFNGILLKDLDIEKIFRPGDHILVEAAVRWYSEGKYKLRATAISFPRYGDDDLNKGDIWITHGTIHPWHDGEVFYIDTEVISVAPKTEGKTVMIRALLSSFHDSLFPEEESTVLVRAKLARKDAPFTGHALDDHTPWEAVDVIHVGGVREGEGYLRFGYRRRLIAVAPIRVLSSAAGDRLVVKGGWIFVPPEARTIEIEKAKNGSKVRYEASVNRIREPDPTWRPNWAKMEELGKPYKWRAISVDVVEKPQPAQNVPAPPPPPPGKDNNDAKSDPRDGQESAQGIRMSQSTVSSQDSSSITRWYFPNLSQLPDSLVQAIKRYGTEDSPSKTSDQGSGQNSTTPSKSQGSGQASTYASVRGNVPVPMVTPTKIATNVQESPQAPPPTLIVQPIRPPPPTPESSQNRRQRHPTGSVRFAPQIEQIQIFEEPSRILSPFVATKSTETTDALCEKCGETSVCLCDLYFV